MDDEQLTFESMYRIMAEIGFKKYFHLGGAAATEELLAGCPIEAGSYVLDVGCASGRTACYVARTYGCRVLGIDIQPGMVERARERAEAEGIANQAEFRVGDAQHLPLGDHLFDVVLGEFLTGLVPDKEQALREYVRVVKPGGTIALNEATWLKQPVPAEITRFIEITFGFKADLLSAQDWTELLTRYGLQGLTHRTFQAESATDRREDLKEMVRLWPRVLLSYLRRPAFRKLLKAARQMPDDLLAYFGYGLYVGTVAA